MGIGRFLVFYIALITASIILSILWSIGMSFEISVFLLIILGSGIIAFPFSALEKTIIPRLQARIAKATSDELKREDDVLLQAVAFSQSILFFLVNLTLEEVKTLFTMIVDFYIVQE